MTTTTADIAPKAAALPPAKGKAGIGGAIASEWTKIRTVRSTYWTLIALIIVAVGLGAAISAGAASELNAHPAHKLGFDTTQVSLFAFLELGQLIIAVLGALVITAEYSTGMIRTSLTVQPRRPVVYAAKALVFAVVAVVVSLVISFVAFFIGQALLSSTGISASLSDPYVLRAIVGGALYVSLAGMLAFGVGAILRHTAGAITITIAALFVIPIIANVLPDTWHADVIRWLPSSAAEILTTTVGPQSTPHLFAPWTQFGVTAGYAVVVLIVGAILFRKRDA
jgi:hypothetical protein